MDTGLDNANYALSNSNAAGTDNILSQKTEGLLLSLSDNFAHNGSNLTLSGDVCEKEKTNGKRSASEFNEEDYLGPETDVDAVDDVMVKSPIDTNKALENPFGNENPFNLFTEHEEKASLETDDGRQKNKNSEFDIEDIPTPPTATVHDVAGLDNATESDSEDEWNYFKGEEANKENIPLPSREVGDMSTAQETNQMVTEPSEEDTMSQLNPNAAEFVPVSPTRSIPSPACKALLNDEVISQSPRRPVAIDINVPNEIEFEKEVKSRPSDIDSYSNGHSDSGHNTSSELMENLLNGISIDEIPEFQPGSTPSKQHGSEEFHFGPNAAPFTPAKLLDQSDTAVSIKAVYGDESNAHFNESEFSQLTTTDLDALNKDSDPMSTSFYAEKGDTTPFDLNKVQVLPANIDDFLKQDDEKPFDKTISDLPRAETFFDDTISDLPEHDPLGRNIVANNDDAIQTTDLDKPSLYEEKELASPLEPEKELGDMEVLKSPHPQEDLLADFVVCERLESSSPIDEIHQLPTMFSPLCEKEITLNNSARVAFEVSGKISEISKLKSPQFDSQVQENIFVCDKKPQAQPLKGNLLELDNQLEPNLPIGKFPESPSKSPGVDLQVESSPVCHLPKLQDPVCDDESAEAEVEKIDSLPVFDIDRSKSPIRDSNDLHVKTSLDVEVIDPSLHEESISSVKDISSSLQALSPDIHKEIESSFREDEATILESNSKFEQGPRAQLKDFLNSSFNERESIATTDVYKFLEKNQIPELTSPLSPSAEHSPDVLDLQQEFDKPEQIDIKTENIAPQFPEQAIVTPSEEPSRQKDIEISAAPLIEKLVQETTQLIEVTTTKVLPPTEDLKEAKKDVKKTATTTEKKPIGKVHPTTKAPSKTATTKTSLTSKTAPTKTSTLRPPVPTTKSVPATKQPLLKPAPRTTTTTSRPINEKILSVNGETKTTSKSTTAIRKAPTIETKVTSKPVSATLTRTSPPAPRPMTVLKTNAILRSATSSRPVASATTTTIPRTRPATLANKIAPSTLTTTKTSATKVSSTAPKPALAPKLRPAINSPLKPMMPTAKPMAKAPDTQKQNKESANKLTASRSATSKTSMTGMSAARVNSLRRNEPKTHSPRTTSKTTTTTIKTISKKPDEITRIARTKTTKIEKPTENEVSTVVTEEITVVGNIANDTANDLIKDNSPIDNKLIVENILTVVNPTD